MPDLPSSPRKTVSSTSQAAKAQTQKKPGAPKPKGAVRAKSGCYTCRIRRKKCDEQPNAEGACQTCVRLRLQCLGFGAKRPDWMRPSHPTPTLSAGSNGDYRQQGPMTSHVREGPHYATLPPPEQQQYHPPPPPPSWQSPHVPELGHPDAAMPTRGLPPMPDMIYPNPPNSMLPPPSLVNVNSSSPSWLNGTSSSSSYNHRSLPPASNPHPHLPQLVSSYGPHYHYSYPVEEEMTVVSNTPGPLIPAQLPVVLPSIPQEQTRFVRHYLHNVLPIQYLLAPTAITSSMLHLIQTYPSARDAACMLSALHMHCMQLDGLAETQQAVSTTYRRLEETLLHRGNASRDGMYTEGDAMAGLHVVSTFLFSGGRGSWDLFLDIAIKFVSDVLNDPKFYGPEDVLKKCSETTRFIIKTTMWFDVLASVTTQQIPRFLSVYRDLFGRQSAYIGEGSLAPEISMLPVMGCENHIVLAIAEISDLACWKESQTRRNSLSVPQLVERGSLIERTYLSADSVYPTSLGAPAGGPGAGGAGAYGNNGLGLGLGLTDPSTVDVDVEILQRRRLTNEIFRASARVYLHTVLSGENPSCPEIMHGVADTIDALRQVPTHAPRIHRDVIRSVVFGICLCGCLTDDRGQRTFLLKMLQSQKSESVGNIGEVQALMERVWERRDNNIHGPGQPVNWRDVMRESTKELLLLV
ncbi:hypothetical protein EIP91_000119 [Steccherinum ochraceum]|uniref:Zn(2)-C6 fungal-type domain-containing protein n=1 Tax=Steccherinum ochraceum TaxID=92696 RepID=A0A4V2MXZ0_9APHY|nr:hypothetical protein EIP91_000119 [Steccherinum ochraceum]